MPGTNAQKNLLGTTKMIFTIDSWKWFWQTLWGKESGQDQHLSYRWTDSPLRWKNSLVFLLKLPSGLLTFVISCANGWVLFIQCICHFYLGHFGLVQSIIYEVSLLEILQTSKGQLFGRSDGKLSHGQIGRKKTLFQVKNLPHTRGKCCIGL
jgi:hypothetical protein